MCNVMPSKCKNVDVSCSCTKCDSVFCLAKENDIRSCSCEDCSGSNTCLFYSSLGLYESRPDATNAIRSSTRTLPSVVSNIARYIASSVVQLVSPQTTNSSCCAATSRTTNDTGTNTIELYRKLHSVPAKYKMEQLKKTYLSQKNKVSAPVLACDADICQTEQEDFSPKKTVPSDRTTEIYRTEILKQKLAAAALKNIYVPGFSSNKKPEELNCHFEKCSEYMLEKPIGYTMDLNKNNQIDKFPENKPIKPAKKRSGNFEFTHILDSNWNTIETPGNQYAHKSQNCECIDCMETKEHKDDTRVFMFDPPGYILDLPRTKFSQKYLPHSTSCSCEVGEAKSPKRCTNVLDTTHGEKCSCISESKYESIGKCKCETRKTEKSKCNKCTENRNDNFNTAGYVIDLPTDKVPIKKKVEKRKGNYFPNSTFCSYQCEEQKPTHKIEQKKTEIEPKGTCQSPFYSQNIKNTQELYQVNLEPQQQIYKEHKKDNCECNVSRKNRYESSGYVLELQQYKPTKNAQELVKDVLVIQGNVVTDLPDMDMFKTKTCECKAKPKSKHEPSGYVFDVPKTTPKKKCTDDTSGCSISKTKIELPGYSFELQNYANKPVITAEKKKCECSESPKSKFDSSGFVFELPKVVQCMNTKSRDKCECSEFGKTKRACNVNNSNMNVNCKHRATAKCKSSSSSGHVNDLPTRKPSARKDSCGCQRLEKIRTGSCGCVFELPKPIPKTTTQKGCKCPESTKSRFDVNRLQMSSNNSNKNNESCVCKGTAKCRRSNKPGYVLDLPTTKNDGCACPKPPKPTIVENKRSKCDCSGGQGKNEISNNQEVFHNKGFEELGVKCKDKRSGYIMDLPTTKPQKSNCECREAKDQYDPQFKVDQPICLPKPIMPKRSCDCSESENKIDMSRYVYELPKPKPETGRCCKCCPKMRQNKPTPVTQKRNCECRETKSKHDSQIKVNQPICMPKPKRKCECSESENKVDLSKYVYTLPKQRSTSKTTVCECRESRNKFNPDFNQPKCTPKPVTSKDNCECPRDSVKCKPKPITQIDICDCPPKAKELPLDLSGYVLDLKTSNKKKCTCPPSIQNKSDLAGYVLDLPKYKSIDHIPDKCECTIGKKSLTKANQVYRIETTIMSPETQNVCNNMLGKQSDTQELLRDLYAPRATPNKHTDLRKNILKTQTEAKDTLKKIYLPQKELQKLPSNSVEPKKSQNLSSDDKTESPCPEGSHLTEVKANETAQLLSTAMLSAEVMDMPYTELNDSLAPTQSGMDKPTKLSKYDIFKRIKEAYKACSCKVCECIVGQVKTETCKCKPCECNECLSYINKTDTKTPNNDINVNSKYQCQKYITNKCLRTLYGASNQQTCDCKPCDCAECTRSIAKLCDCGPCQCLECKTRSIHQRQTLVVAPVGREENVQRLACTCSPCDCIECGLVQPLASNVMHEMSTGTNRHALCRCEICLNEVCDQRDVDSCSCQRRNKVMSKPVEKSTHDFDIRTATMNHSKPLYSRRKRKSSTHDTIAMYAAVPTNYHALTSNDDISSKDEMCNCDECECVNCVCQEEAVINIKSSQLFSSFRTITKSDLNVRSKSILNSYEDCKSQKSCSCQLCKRQYGDSHRIYTSASYSTEDCECEPCECIKCGRDLISDCYPSHILCQRVKSKPIITYDHTYREEKLGTANPLIKKGEVLTPSTYRFKVQNEALRKRNLNALNVSEKKVMSNKSSMRKSPKSAISHKLTNQSSTLSKQTFSMSPSFKIGSITIANLNDTKKPQIVNKNNSIDNEMSSYLSGYSSLNTSPNTSGHRKYCSSTSPVSRNKCKSWESSCNSSGHDYPEYLIQFPQSTADSGLKDAMELSSNQTKSSVNSNLSPKSDSNYIINKLSCDDVSIRENTTDKTSFLDTFNSEMTSNKQNESKKAQQRQQYYDSDNNSDELSRFCDVPKNAVVASSQFYKLDMRNKSNYQKNKNIKYITDKIHLKDPRLFADSRYSLKNDKKKTKYFNLVNNLNDFYLSRKAVDSNIVHKKAASAELPVRRETHNNTWYPNFIPRPSFINSTDIINAADFKRVRKTLKEAKEFSLELIRLLNMYENANKEFESISDKLKLSHACLISGDFEVKKEEPGNKNNIMKTNQDQEKCYNIIENELHGKRSVPPSAELNTDLQITTISDKDISNLENVRVDDNSSENVAHPRNINLLEEIEINFNKDEHFYNDLAKEETSEQAKTTENIEAKKDVTKDSFSRIEDISAKNNKDIRKKEQISKKKCKKYKMPKRKVIILRRINVRSSNEIKAKIYRVTVGTSTTALSNNTSKRTNAPNTELLVNFSEKVDQQKYNAQEHCKDLKQIMKKIDSVFSGIEEVPVSSSTETNGLDNQLHNYASNNTVTNHGLKEKSPWPILRKNFSWSARPPTNGNEISNFPSLDLEIKQRVQSISQQTGTPRKRRHENKALANLQVEVQKLLDMPMLQSQQCNRYPVEYPKGTLNMQPETILESKFEEMPESSYWSVVDKGVGCSLASITKSEFEETPQSLGSYWSTSMVDEGASCSVMNNIAFENEKRPELVRTYWETVDRGVVCNFTNKMTLESKDPLESLHSCWSHVSDVDEEWVGCCFVKNNGFKLKQTPGLLQQCHKEVFCSIPINQELSSHIQDLQDTAALLPMFKKEIEFNDNVGTTSPLSSICENTSSDDMRVHFTSVHRVSDHTVLVKWNATPLRDKVKGYEILVDGRAVKKIFTPLKTIAVITCLPNIDKLLLTIRTITKLVPMTGHYPASTIIYRPRVKQQ